MGRQHVQANPGDGGASQTGALRTAIALAAVSQAQLRIVHAVDTANINPGREFPMPPAVAEGLVKSGQEILRRSEAAAAAAGVVAETCLIAMDDLDQRVPEAIANDAETWPAYLIAIGAHGRRGLRRPFPGSVAEGIARVATQPVLLVRGQ